MSEYVWPKVESARAYDMAVIDPAARPRHHEQIRRVDEFPFAVYVPRRTAQNVPGEQVYWCWSCNRRTASVNQPFCATHRPLRERFTRRARDAYKRPVPLARARVTELHGLKERLDTAIYSFDQGDPEARRQAWREVHATRDLIGLFLLLNLPQQPRSRSPVPPLEGQREPLTRGSNDSNG